MTSIVLCLVVSALITQAITEAVNHGSIFERLRHAGWAADATYGITRIILTPLRAIYCPYCFSHWAGMLAVAACTALPEITYVEACLSWLPSVRLANTLNDVLSSYSRTPGRSEALRLDQAGLTQVEARLTQLLEQEETHGEEKTAVGSTAT